MFTPTVEEYDGTPFKIIPEEKKYNTVKKQGHLIVKFEKVQGRKFCFENSPFPGVDEFAVANAHERRFDLPKVKLDALGKHRNSTMAPKLANYSNRKELWPVLDLPDSQIYAHQFQQSFEKDPYIDLGSIKFEKRSNRKGHVIMKHSQGLSYDA